MLKENIIKAYPITRIWTVWGLTFSIGFFAFAFLVIVSIGYHFGFLILGAITLAACIAAVLLWQRWALAKRDAALKTFAATNGYIFNDVNVSGVDISFGSLSHIHNAKNPQSRNVVHTNDWTYCDFSYEIEHRSRNGDYIAAKVQYAIMSVKLPRMAPHLFFDSIKARGRQFRFEFARSQRISLEGDFDQYFVTYVPDNYHIDTLSFIGPDTMLTLRDAAKYDIEIIGDHLLLYGALDDPAIQLPDMIAKITAIKAQLVHDITVYRDHRLPYEVGRQMVTAGGAALKRSMFWTIVGTVFVVIYVALYLIDIFTP